MKGIGKRIQRLEAVMAPHGLQDRWGRMGATRDDLIRRAAPDCRDDLRAKLEALGPVRLWADYARRFLADHGFVQTERERFAETMARALDIGTEDLRILIAQGCIGKALLARFVE
jgi:hypothetical protein